MYSHVLTNLVDVKGITNRILNLKETNPDITAEEMLSNEMTIERICSSDIKYLERMTKFSKIVAWDGLGTKGLSRYKVCEIMVTN